MKVPTPVVHYAAGPALRALMGTWRWSVVGQEHYNAVQGGPFVLLCWHEALLPLLWYHRAQGITIVVSEARDGTYLADFARGIGYDLIRGSSSQGGVRVLRSAIRTLNAGRPVAFTPDGPRGPRRQLKLGVLRAAQQAGVPVLPLHCVPKPTWRLKSWDRLVVPRPFARVEVRYGAAFLVPPGSAGLRQAALVTDERLCTIVEAA